MTTKLKKYLAISAIVHVVAFGVFLYWGDLFGLFPKKPTKITWVRLSKGTGENPSEHSFVKAKGLPETTISELKDPVKGKDKKGKDPKSNLADKKKPPSRVEEYRDKNKPKPDTGGVKIDPKKNAIDQKTDDALQRINEMMEKRRADIEAAQIKEEGTGQSPDGTLNASNTESDPELIAYYGALKRKINQEWITTPKLFENGASLKTEVNVLIDATGQIINVSFETKSGNVSFDLSAQRAVERAGPFPPPPDKIKDEALTEGFLIEFNPRNVVGTF